ncbi:hypothetical protein CBR_g32441 [Chara braunii]|uniref:Reverse transcriptase domain-containing protein n=1 Tax=Chara braunii TaxID=69332 RepID=A0A388LGJ6_CHABU|nr:hypothetical protein CBR_g32441 [Chara braunii]|eukprot:GBG81450.1 hypothetical protein CBR_g32441 [Chara braunii]
MGICNAPATFQRAMNVTFHNFVNKTRLTQGMINFCVIVYMDDILVYSETYHGHVQHIKWTLSALRDAGFKIALEKSEIFLSKISFLGYVVTRGGLRPDSRKVVAVREASVLTSLTQVRAFLGLASYYRCFIKGFATIARPLTNLLRKDQSLSWDAECQQAFATLKDALATAPILIRPDPSKQFILITDWQPEAISAILAQKGNDGREHVIEYASRTVPDERRNDFAPQELSLCLVEVRLTWIEDEAHPPCIERLELLFIQAWRTNVEGEFLAFLFGAVRPDHQELITQELTILVAQLVDDLPLDIISQDDKHPVPHKEPRQHLDPRAIRDPAFFRQPTAEQLTAIQEEKEEEESTKSDDGEDEREESEEGDEVLGEEDETPEEGSYSEHGEGEQSEKEEEDEEGEEGHEEESAGPEWEAVPEEALRTGTEAEDPEAAPKREEIAAEKTELELTGAGGAGV